MCFIYPWWGARDGREEEAGMRGGEGGWGVCDERPLSLFSSFQLFEASHQTGLNSRHDTISLSSTTTFLCLYLTHTHPPPPIKALASIYLRPPASVHPFTGSQCCPVTSDRTLREETQPKRSSMCAQIFIVAASCVHAPPSMHLGGSCRSNERKGWNSP